MKVFSFVISTLLLLASPTRAIEYQGKTLDGKKLAATVYVNSTGGTYTVQVEFKQQLATIYFPHGGQTTLQLTQRVITDPQHIQAIGKLGQVYLGKTFRVGLNYDQATDGFALSGAPVLDDVWNISLDAKDLKERLETEPKN